ncbi:hypothetical protein HA402_001214 [Bradysia odoriphaga]|nr:hypothetical protein HA402_001214 [Bradysia odoriphaga]
MNKSYLSGDPRIKYCLDHSTPLNEYVEELIKASLKHPSGLMTGAEGVLQTCSAVIAMIQARNVLDIGLFTGVSALTWATIIPEDGKVISMDLEEESYNTIGKKFVEKSGVGHKIDIRIQPATQTLQDLINSGQSGKFDFAFLDANKPQYPEYYTLCMQLLRIGGVLAVDNALWEDKVLQAEKDRLTIGIDKLNKMSLGDQDVQNVLLPIEDGVHLIVKKN